MLNEVKLLPCPFCGEEPFAQSDFMDSDLKQACYIACRKCDISPDGCYRKAAEWPEAIAAWNTRPTTLVTDEVVERVNVTWFSQELRELFRRHFIAWGDSTDWEKIARKALDSLSLRAAIASMPTVVTGEQQSAVAEIAAERRRQVEAEGWTLEHDANEHQTGDIARAAACYALGYAAPKLLGGELFKRLWPDDWEWKPDGAPTPLGCRRRQLVKAGALIVAEIERIDRYMPLPEPPAQPGDAQ